MNRRRCNCVATIVALLLATSAPLRADVAGEVRSILGDKLVSKGEVGVEIIRLGEQATGDRVVYEFKAGIGRIPASNMKVVTTAAAMEKLGKDFQFRTTLAGRANGDIALIGDGDPTLGDAEMLHKVGWDVTTVFKTWAELLKTQGITQVNNVYVDDSIFDEQFVHPDWPVDQQHKRYVAGVGGVNLNANCLDFYLTQGGGNVVAYRTDPPTSYTSIKNTCVWGNRDAVWLSRTPNTNNIILRGETNVANDVPVSVTIYDPPMYAGTVLAETLAANGIKLAGTVQRDRTIRDALSGVPAATQPSAAAPASKPSESWKPLAVHATPLEAVISRANKDSMNLYAEALCKRIGAAATNQPGSWESGTAFVGSFLESIGVGRDEFNLVDGCGLSKKNAVSPSAMTKVLAHMFHGSDREAYVATLAVAGVDGTLDNRFRDSDLRGRVFGKSGYVNGVSTLSGFLHARNDEWYAFSIMFNTMPNDGVAGAKQMQERIVRAVDTSSGPATASAGVAAGR